MGYGLTAGRPNGEFTAPTSLVQAVKEVVFCRYFALSGFFSFFFLNNFLYNFF